MNTEYIRTFDVLGRLGGWTFDEWQIQAFEIRGSREGRFAHLESTQTFRSTTSMFNFPLERKGTLNLLAVWHSFTLCFTSAVLFECNKMAADYLFQPDKHYDVSYDTGDKVIQCGRHNDIFKFWLMWRAKVIRLSNLMLWLLVRNR